MLSKAEPRREGCQEMFAVDAVTLDELGSKLNAL
jgi:hypothetical protein